MNIHEAINQRLDEWEAAASQAPIPDDEMASGDEQWWTYFAEPADTIHTERLAIEAFLGLVDPSAIRTLVAGLRKIVELHKNWPILVQGPDEFEGGIFSHGLSPNEISYRMTRKIAWVTQQDYRSRFGDEPPTAPIILALAEALGVDA